MRRLMWMTVGAAVAVVAMRRFSRFLDERVPPQVRETASRGRHAVGAARGLLGDVRAGMAAREEELRAALFTESRPSSSGPAHRAPTTPGRRRDLHEDEPLYEF